MRRCSGPGAIAWLALAFLASGGTAGVAPLAAQEVIPPAELTAAELAARSAEAESQATVTLAEALQRAAGVDPDYVAALRGVGDAAWVRRSAWSAFLLPVIDLRWSFSKYSSPQFNIGTGEETDRLTQFALTGSYTLFNGGRRIFDMQAANAGVDGAEADERRQRFTTALGTEADYYDVLAQSELMRVAAERVRRAEEQLAVARARVLAGAAVQSDSLQLLLELTRAQVDLLRQESVVAVARLQLGRRTGIAGPVDAAPLDTLPAPELPISEAQAIEEAVTVSPIVEVARAEERRANALFKSERSSYLPSLSVFGSWAGFDDDIVPDATKRSTFGLSLNFPIWDGAQREIRIYRASTARQIAEAARRDTELGIGRDMAEAYQAYSTARASAELAANAVVVARENLRVQEERYRAGATTIIDLLTAQVDMTEAEAGLVQARYTTRLARAGVEAILGRRLTEKR
jgi:outer membrane protein TolC